VVVHQPLLNVRRGRVDLKVQPGPLVALHDQCTRIQIDDQPEQGSHRFQIAERRVVRRAGRVALYLEDADDVSARAERDFQVRPNEYERRHGRAAQEIVGRDG
jgi:hypothetical protein